MTGNDSRQAFLDYTLSKMDDAKIIARFSSLKEKCYGLLRKDHGEEPLKVLDIGCGMGVQARIWAKDGFRVTACDIDADLISAGKAQGETDGLNIEWVVGSASETTLPDAAFDVCLAVELLEHVADWQGAVSEFARVLRPGGLLLLTTTNVISPVQYEFRLPVYSWWPGFLKRKAVELARTTRPELANFTDYPALHWFSYWGLKRELERLDFDVKDRIDLVDLDDKSALISSLVSAARILPPLRLGAYLFLDGTCLYARKKNVS